MSVLYTKAEYLLNAHKLIQCPPDEGLEVAFAGRSNAGKSSAINVITNQQGLARTSKTPGRTQHIVFFTLDTERRLVDLPGYGYAKVPAAIKAHWQHTLELYLAERQSLQGVMLMMDVRHPLTEQDQQMLHWCQVAGMPVHVLLTKADKFSRGKAGGVLQQVRAYCDKTYQDEFAQPLVSLQLFSALKKTGVEEAHQQLDRWFELS